MCHCWSKMQSLKYYEHCVHVWSSVCANYTGSRCIRRTILVRSEWKMAGISSWEGCKKWNKIQLQLNPQKKFFLIITNNFCYFYFFHNGVRNQNRNMRHCCHLAAIKTKTTPTFTGKVKMRSSNAHTSADNYWEDLNHTKQFLLQGKFNLLLNHN